MTTANIGTILRNTPMRSEGLYSTSPLDEIINPGGRIVAPEACKRFMLKLHELPEPQLLGALERLATAFRASPHNRHACAGPAGMVNDLLHLLPNYQGAARERVLELLRLLGAHRFEVHNMRLLLAKLQVNEASAGRASVGSEQERQAAGAAALELLELLCDIVGGADEGHGTPRAFWDMGVGVLGATGFELPADRVAQLAAKGGFSFCAWVRIEPPCADPGLNPQSSR
jgi:hypothetical protein